MHHDPNVAVFTTRRVLERHASVVRVICDDDGDWQALDALPRSEEDGAVISLASLLELHPDVVEAVAIVDQRGAGWQAVKESEGAWRLLPFNATA